MAFPLLQALRPDLRDPVESLLRFQKAIQCFVDRNTRLISSFCSSAQPLPARSWNGLLEARSHPLGFAPSVRLRFISR